MPFRGTIEQTTRVEEAGSKGSNVAIEDTITIGSKVATAGANAKSIKDNVTAEHDECVADFIDIDF